MAVTPANIPSQLRTPLFYAEMDNTQAGYFSTKGRTLLYGIKTTGTATAKEQVLCATPGQAYDLFGIDSDLAKMVEAYRDNDLVGELWCMPFDSEPDLAAIQEANLNLGDMAFDFIAMPWSTVEILDEFKTLMDDSAGRWSYSKRIYGHVYSVKRDSLSALQAFGTLRNDQHVTCFGIEPEVVSSDIEYLAARVAQEAMSINADPARPTQARTLSGIKGAPITKRFVLSETETLLDNGIATHITGDDGSINISRSITTYQKNKWNVKDPSYLDSETMHTSAYVLRRLEYMVTQEWPNHKLADDGTEFGAGQAIVTPAIIHTRISQEYYDMEDLGILENAELALSKTIVERADDPNRVNVLFAPDYVNQLRVFALINQFRLQYRT